MARLVFSLALFSRNVASFERKQNEFYDKSLCSPLTGFGSWFEGREPGSGRKTGLYKKREVTGATPLGNTGLQEALPPPNLETRLVFKIKNPLKDKTYTVSLPRKAPMPPEAGLLE